MKLKKILLVSLVISLIIGVSIGIMMSGSNSNQTQEIPEITNILITKNVSEIGLNENDLLEPQTAEYWTRSHSGVENSESVWASKFTTGKEILNNEVMKFTSIDEAKQEYIEINKNLGSQVKLTSLKYGDESFGFVSGSQAMIVIRKSNIIITLEHRVGPFSNTKLKNVEPYAEIILGKIT